MVRLCAVPSCRNKQSGEISLHIIPADELRAKLWCDAMGIEKLVKSAVVCSSHFTPDDFFDNITSTLGKPVMKRRLKNNAIPSLKNTSDDGCLVPSGTDDAEGLDKDKLIRPKNAVGIGRKSDMVLDNKVQAEKKFWYTEDADQFDSDDDNENLESWRINNEIKNEAPDSALISCLLVCRSCLVANCKLFSINEDLIAAYAQITDTSIENYTIKLCLECMAIFKKCHEFRVKTKLAGCLLNKFGKFGKRNSITITEIDRIENKLASSLGTTHIVGYNDTYIYDQEDDAVTTETDDKADVFVKEEIDTVPDQATNSSYTDVIKMNIEICDSDNATNDTIYEQGFDSEEIKREPRMVQRKTRKFKTKSKPSWLKKKEEDDELLKKHFKVEVFKTIKEQIVEFEKRKETTNYKEGRFKCDNCFRGFVDEQAFKMHQLRYDPSQGRYACPVCRRRLPARRRLNTHTDRHERRYSCRTCDFATVAKPTAKQHLLWHKGKTFKCKHADCGREFAIMTTYMSHLRMSHHSDHVCGHCGYSFISRKGVAMHSLRKHATRQIPEDGPSCDDCNVRFASDEALQKHLRVSFKHGGLERNERNYEHKDMFRKPQKGTANAAWIRKGETGRVHPASIRTMCEQCGAQLPSHAAYAHHMRREHPQLSRSLASLRRGCLCDVCGKVFSCPATLTDHLYTHSDDASFKCDICGKCFKKQFNLRVHRSRHQGHRYPCDLCGKLFTQHGNRRRHMLVVHSNVKEVKCEYCEKKFGCNERRKQHIEHVHLKKPWPKRVRNRAAERQGLSDRKKLIVIAA